MISLLNCRLLVAMLLLLLMALVANTPTEQDIALALQRVNGHDYHSETFSADKERSYINSMSDHDH